MNSLFIDFCTKIYVQEPDYIVASRLLLPLLVKFNQSELLLTALENRLDYGIVKGQHTLTGQKTMYTIGTVIFNFHICRPENMNIAH